jgi:hypothetical protein
MKNNFVAYPYENYPAELFDKTWYLSFAALPDKTHKRDNSDVSFKKAIIEITDDKNNKIIISSKKEDNLGYGISNILAWKASGLKENVKYNVLISNVDAKDDVIDYSYYFILTNK